MPPLTPASLLLAVLQYGPNFLPLIAQIQAWIKEDKKEVTPEDIALLVALGAKTSGDYLKEVGLTP